MRSTAATSVCLVFGCLTLLPPAAAEDQPQLGQQYTRNMVSDEKGLPDGFSPGFINRFSGEVDLATTKNVKWAARLGRQTHGTPVVAGGKVLVGTNNEVPRDLRVKFDAGVLMCFDEQTGQFLWQLLVPKLSEIKHADWYYIGLCGSPVVEAGRAYLVTNRCEVVCLDMEGMANGNDGPFAEEGRHMVPPGFPPLEPGAEDADIVWTFDMAAELGVRPHNAANCSVLLYGDLLYVCTSNGLDHTHNRVVNPDAPLLAVVDKTSGKLIAKDNFGVGGDVIHGQWSSPTLAQLGDTVRLFQGAGNGRLYGFDPIDPAAAVEGPIAIEPVWSVNGHPAAQTEDEVPIEHGIRSKSYEVVANPVFHNNRIYVAITQDPFYRQREGWLTCFDATGTGDVTRTGLVWSYDATGTCITTVSIADGLVYAAGHDGRLHCLDAETGEPYWVHPVGGPVWGSTLVADGRVYLGTGRRSFWVLKHGKELQVINRVRLPDRTFSTPVAANGVVYVATFRHLYALEDPVARAKALAEPAPAEPAPPAPAPEEPKP